MVVPAEQIERRGAPLLTPAEALNLLALEFVASDYGLSPDELMEQMGSDPENPRALQIQKDIKDKEKSFLDEGD